MQDPTLSRGGTVDTDLLHAFEERILARTPHLESGRVVNPTPLVDLTEALKECAKGEYGLDLSGRRLRVYGKLESPLPGGSVKSRAAMQIVHEAIKTGKLRRGMVVFEATSGNFGISLGMLGSLGVEVVALVSRKLQEGVLEELGRSGVKTVDLDVDVCPAPGMLMDPNLLLAKVVASKMRERFAEIGLGTGVFDSSLRGVEELLGRQDVINLAKLLADAYGGFCPEQYDNEQNVLAHSALTGPEIDQQLAERGTSLESFQVVCAFGTGGTSGGLSRYVQQKYGRKAVHVVFPPEGKDVAGIRTKSKAEGLRFYEPTRFAGEHEVDFEQAKKLFGFMVKRGVDIGESSALALYAVLQLANFGNEGDFVVVLADGAGKYRRTLESARRKEESDEGIEVTADGARSNPERYGEVLWTHMGYVPTDEGKALIASTLGVPVDSVKVASPQDVVTLVTRQEIAGGMRKVIGDGDREGKRVLLVCMSGNTSLRAAQALEGKGVKSQSLTGGITRLAQSGGKSLPALVRQAG